jgi:hypothetical protein
MRFKKADSTGEDAQKSKDDRTTRRQFGIRFGNRPESSYSLYFGTHGRIKVDVDRKNSEKLREAIQRISENKGISTKRVSEGLSLELLGHLAQKLGIDCTIQEVDTDKDERRENLLNMLSIGDEPARPVSEIPFHTLEAAIHGYLTIDEDGKPISENPTLEATPDEQTKKMQVVMKIINMASGGLDNPIDEKSKMRVCGDILKVMESETMIGQKIREAIEDFANEPERSVRLVRSYLKTNQVSFSGSR